ncbi:MAG: energy transducer TonB [Janthinobacterium lividum]
MSVRLLIFVTLFIAVKTAAAQKQLAPAIEIRTVQLSEPQFDQTIYCNFGHDGDAQFVGGEKALIQFIHENFKQKPLPTGKIITVFIIEKDGSLTDIHILRGITKKANNEAIRVIKSMPKWIPSIVNGKAFRVAYTVPFIFN